MPDDVCHFVKYLTVTYRDIRWKAYCTTVGSTKIPTATRYPPVPSDHPPKYLQNWDKGRVFNEFALIYITAGGGRLRTQGDTEHRVSTGSIFMLFPYVWHWYVPDWETGWDEYWVGFNGAYPKALVKSGFFSPENPVMDIGLHDSVLEIYRDIFDCAKAESPGYQQMLGALIMQLLAQVSSLRQQHGPDSDNERLVEKAKFLLADNVYSNLSVRELAESLGLTSQQFRQVFKKYTGLSPYQYYLQLKINRAKEMLQQKQLSVKEIAFQLSFEDQYYFSNLFKKKTGHPPSEWR